MAESKGPMAKKEKLNVAYLRDKNNEKVKGVFHYYELPGGRLEFFFREFKGDEIEKYSLVDGQVCEIPLGVAKHLNKNGWYPRHKYSVDENGKPIQKIGEKVRRFGFSSLEFVDIEDLNMPDKQIITI